MNLIQKNIKTSFSGNSNGCPYPNSQQISIVELESRSRILARIIRDSGCKKSDPICCVMNKSIDLLMALRGISYAGCTGVPISPNRSVDRIQSIILSSRANWIVADRSATSLLSTAKNMESTINVGWMDTTEMLPESCLPEFVRDNINHISLHPVLQEQNKQHPFVTFYTQNGTGLQRSTYSQDEIEKFVLPILEWVQVDTDSRIAGLMSWDSPAFLLEIMSLDTIGAQLFLFNSDPKQHTEQLLREIREQQITHLFCESVVLENLIEKAGSSEASCSNLEKVIIWEKESYPVKPDELIRTFPDVAIYTITDDSNQRLLIQTNEFSTEFTPVASIPARGTILQR